MPEQGMRRRIQKATAQKDELAAEVRAWYQAAARRQKESRLEHQSDMETLRAALRDANELLASHEGRVQAQQESLTKASERLAACEHAEECWRAQAHERIRAARQDAFEIQRIEQASRHAQAETLEHDILAEVAAIQLQSLYRGYLVRRKSSMHRRT